MPTDPGNPSATTGPARPRGAATPFRPRGVAMTAFAFGVLLVTGSMNGAAASAGPVHQELSQVYAEGLFLAVSRGVLPLQVADRALLLADQDSGLSPDEKSAILADLASALARAPAPSALDQAALDGISLRFGALTGPAAVETALEIQGLDAEDPCESECNRNYWICALICILQWSICMAESKGWGVLVCYAQYLVCLFECGSNLKACLDDCETSSPVQADLLRLKLPPVPSGPAAVDRTIVPEALTDRFPTA